MLHSSNTQVSSLGLFAAASESLWLRVFGVPRKVNLDKEEILPAELALLWTLGRDAARLACVQTRCWFYLSGVQSKLYSDCWAHGKSHPRSHKTVPEKGKGARSQFPGFNILNHSGSTKF